jgi:hypothetical protein
VARSRATLSHVWRRPVGSRLHRAGSSCTQLDNLRTHPSVALALSQKKLRLHGWVFDIESGEIDALDHQSGRFVDLVGHPDVYAHAG